MQKISFKIGIPYLIKSGRKCENNRKQKSKISDCMKIDYTNLLRDAPRGAIKKSNN